MGEEENAGRAKPTRSRKSLANLGFTGNGPEVSFGSGESEAAVEGIGSPPSSGLDSSVSQHGGSRIAEDSGLDSSVGKGTLASVGNARNANGRRTDSISDNQNDAINDSDARTGGRRGNLAGGREQSVQESEVRFLDILEKESTVAPISEVELEAPSLELVSKTPKPPVVGGAKGKKQAPTLTLGTSASKTKKDADVDMGDQPLTADELAVFIQALQDLSEMTDSGLWYIGLDTDPDVVDRQGYPGVPIWKMDEDEASKVAKSFMALGKRRPEVYKAMRAVNASHDHMQAGLVLGSRLATTFIRLFEMGFNFRMSKAAWQHSVERAIGIEQGN